MTSTPVNASHQKQIHPTHFWGWLDTTELAAKLVATVWSLSEPFGVESEMD